MSTIQDIHALSEQIYAVIEDYIRGEYDEDDMLGIYNHCGDVMVEADKANMLRNKTQIQLYALPKLTRKDEFGNTKPDNDKIDQISNIHISTMPILFKY